jgi:hypothetical protein
MHGLHEVVPRNRGRLLRFLLLLRDHEKQDQWLCESDQEYAVGSVRVQDSWASFLVK